MYYKCFFCDEIFIDNIEECPNCGSENITICNDDKDNCETEWEERLEIWNER